MEQNISKTRPTKASQGHAGRKRHASGFRGPSPDVGKATQIKRGEVRNPAGRPRTAKFSDAMRLLLAEVGPGGTTNAEALAAVCLKKGLKGSPRHLELAMNYAEGKPKQGLEISGPDGGALEYADLTMEQLYARCAALSIAEINDPLNPVGVLAREQLAKGSPQELPRSVLPAAEAAVPIVGREPDFSIPAATPQVSEADLPEIPQSVIRRLAINRYLMEPKGR